MSHFTFDKLPGNTALVNGHEYLFFSGYAYLGLQYHAGFKTLVREGMDRYGWLFPSSRISNTRIALFEECEQLLSSISGCEDTVLVSTGYTAGRLATAMFQNDIANLTPSHPAIKRGSHNTAKGIYAVDSIDILTSSITNIAAINQTPGLATLIVDDSHGVGLTGNNGAGASSYTERKQSIDYIFTYSLSKAWGINAGAVSCPKNLAEEYRRMPAYTGATAPSPALVYAFTKGQDIYAQQRQKLQQNIQYFQSLTAGIAGIRHDKGLPMFVLPKVDEDVLVQNGIIISSFAYPDPSGPRIQRAVINSLHTKGNLECLAECLEKAVAV